jgi:hypothetical protein
VESLLGKSRVLFVVLILTAGILPSCGEYINNPSPASASLKPNSIPAGTPLFTLMVLGNNFAPTSIVEWSGTATGGMATPLTTSIFVSQTEMTAQIPATFVQNPGTATVTVFTPEPGGGTTTPLLFTILPTPSPVPSIASLNPSVGIAGGSGFGITVTGTNFVSTSTVSINNANHVTTFIDSTTLFTELTSADLAAAGDLQVVVFNPPVNPPPPPPQPNGGASNPFPLHIFNPAPVITMLAPTGAQAGAVAATTLMVTGTGFLAASQVEINGEPRTTVLISDTQVSTQLTVADLAVGGIDQIQVFNPAPGGGASNILPLAVNPTKSAGLLIVVDLAPDGSQANNGVCGTTCANGTPSFTTAGPSTNTSGQFVVFASTSTNLVAGGISSSSDIFLRNTCLGTSATCVPLTSQLSTAPNGSPANGPSFEPTVDSAGANVAFTSTATNLVTSAPLNGVTKQVFWRPTCSTASTCSGGIPTQLVSLSADGVSAGNGDSFNPMIDSSGRFVVFASRATNLVANLSFDGATTQIFLRDTCSGQLSATCAPTTFLVSTPDGVTPANGSSTNPAIASTGIMFVTFTSTATNLGATAPNPGGAQEIFVRSCPNLLTTCTAITSLASTPDGATPANGASSSSAITNDGRFIAFVSTATNLGVNSGAIAQVYVRDTCTGVTGITCNSALPPFLISSSDGTTPANAPSEHPSVNTPTLNTNSLVVAFATKASNVAANTVNGVENVFVRNTCAALSSNTVSCAPGTVLASQGGGPSPAAANGDSLAPSISQDGHTVSFLSSANNLVQRDTNGFADVFLASTTF